MSLFVIDGLDGSGKATQTKLLAQALEKNGLAVRTVSFPDYESDACMPVKMYLRGDFGKTPGSVNAYAASSFYAVDRYASYKTDWGKDYEAGMTILCDRYTTSNDIHQMAKLDPVEWDAFLAWHQDYEYARMGIPVPDCVIYLDMDPEVSRALISGRYSGDETKRDIHENDFQYLLSCREAAHYAGEKQGWTLINCTEDGKPLPLETIHKMIMAVLEG